MLRILWGYRCQRKESIEEAWEETVGWPRVVTVEVGISVFRVWIYFFFFSFFFFFFFKLNSTLNMGLQLKTPRSRVICSTD